MDALSAVIDRHRGQHAFVLRCHLAAPWALAIEDDGEVGVLLIVEGSCVLSPGASSTNPIPTAEPITLHPGDVVIAKGVHPYVIGDDAATAPTVVVDPGQNCCDLDGNSLALSMGLGVRSWGVAGTPDNVFVTANWELPGQITGRLLDDVDDVAVIRHGTYDPALVDLLLAEIGRDVPGQDVVVDRLVDVLLVSMLRHHFAHREAQPAWWRGHEDRLVGEALALLHNAPDRQWSLEALAGEVHVSRATLARRFTEAVGTPPMTYLAEWRLDVAADRLRDGGATVAAIAREVGYVNPFAFTNAFKRRYGHSPTDYRRLAS